MLAGLLYILAGAALLVHGPAGYRDIYCWRYTGTSAAAWNNTCAGYGPCAAGSCTLSPAETAALLAFKARAPGAPAAILNLKLTGLTQNL
jgi:hypothetical protein